MKASERHEDETSATAVQTADADIVHEPIGDGVSPDPNGEVRDIEYEIEALRAELGDLVDELDRRRHEVTNVPLQASRHATALMVVGVAGALLLVSLAMYARRARQPDPLPVRMRKLGQALSIVARDPDRLLNAIERRPNPRMALLGALTQIGGAAGKRAILKHAR